MITRPERSPFRKIARVSFNFGVWNVHRQRGYPLPIFIDFVIIPRQDVILVAVNVSRKRPQNMALSRGIMISKESKKKIFEVLCFPFFAEENCRSAPRNLPAVEVDAQRNATSAAEDTAVDVSVTKATSKFCVDATSAAKALQSSKTNFKSFDGSATSAAKVAPCRSPFFKGFDSNLTSAAYFNFFLVFTNARKPKSSLIFFSRGFEGKF